MEGRKSTMDYRDTASIHRLLTSLTQSLQHNENQEASELLGNIIVRVQLSVGSYNRIFPVYQSDLEALRPILESEEYQHTYYALSTGQLTTPEELLLRDRNRNITYTLTDKEQITNIMEAYQKDFEEYSQLEELNSGIVLCDINALLSQDKSINLRIPVYEHYHNTIELLKSQGEKMVTTLSDLEIACVKLSCSIDSLMPREGLYSFFQLEGYPQYNDLKDEVYPEKGKSTGSTIESQGILLETTVEYTAVITEQGDINELLPYLHIGADTSYAPFSPVTY